MNTRVFQISAIIGAVLLAPSCSKVDDYMLGKDNTPTPAKLESITPKMDLAKTWSAPVGRGQKSTSYLKVQPVVQAEVVYVASPSGSVSAIRSTDGSKLWETGLGYALTSGPTVGNGYIAVTDENSDLIVLKQVDGSMAWKQKVSSEVLAKPVITHNKIIAKTINGDLSAFRLVDGKALWSSHHGAPSLILKASSSPTVMNANVVLSGYSDGKLDAIELSTGRTLWQRSLTFAKGSSDIEKLVDIDANPLVRGDVLYLASYQGSMGALSLKDGNFLWRRPASVYKNMSISGNYLYFTDSEDVVWSVNRHSGKVRWKQDKLKARGLTEPDVSNKQLFLADRTGYLHILSAETGEVIGRQSVGAAVAVAPVVKGKDVFIFSANGQLSQYKVS